MWIGSWVGVTGKQGEGDVNVGGEGRVGKAVLR